MKAVHSCAAARLAILVGAALFLPHTITAGPAPLLAPTAVSPTVIAGQRIQLANSSQVSAALRVRLAGVNGKAIVARTPQSVNASDVGPNPVPLINQPLVPITTVPGGGAFTLAVNGTNFVSGATVNWNGSPRTTTFVSSSQLTAAINAADIAVAGTASITVFNPTPGGGTSNVVFFVVTSSTSSVVFGNATGSPMAAGSQPRSIAVGDFNGDGKMDLAVANYTGNNLTVLLANGDGTFTPTALNPATGSHPHSVAVGDFNSDGKLDLAVANESSNNLTILLGDGTGNFTPAASPATGAGPLSVAVADLNGDGKLDLAVANSSSNTVTILLGNGDGTFTPTDVSPATGTNPLSVAVGDFDGDGMLDLAVSNFVSNTVTILLGNGDGTFTATDQSPPTGTSPRSVAAADFNGDGKLDLVIANIASNNLTILLGDGLGGFAPAASPAVGTNPHSVAVGDFNGDGKLDLAAANDLSNNVTILLGDGTGNFTSAAQSPATGNNPRFVVVEDFNGDGRLDLAVANLNGHTVSILSQVPIASILSVLPGFPSVTVGATSATQTTDLVNTGSATLTISSIVSSGDFAQTNDCGSSIAAGSHCDIFVTFTPTTAGNLTGSLTLTDDSNGVVGSTQTMSLTGTGTTPSLPVASLSPASLTFSSQSVGTTSGSQPVILSNTGSAALTITSIATSANFGQTNTCSGDSIAGGSSCTINVTFTPTAAGTLTGTLTVTDNSNGLAGSTQTANLSGTGANPVPLINQPLAPTASAPGGGPFTLTVNGTGFVNGATVNWNGSPRTTTFISSSQLAAAINDADLAVAGTASTTVFNPTPGGGTSNVVFFSITQPTGTLSFSKTDYSSGTGPLGIAIGDFNGDGIKDIAVTNVSDNTVSVYLGNGNGTFTSSGTFATGTKPLFIAAGDFNHDGALDLAVADKNCTLDDSSCAANGEVSILLGNGNGTFQNHVDYATGKGSVDITVGDFNGDGNLDLAVENEYSNTVSILLGNGDGTFQTNVDYAVQSFPAGIATGDFNGDGRLDLAVVNSGDDDVSILLGNGDGTFTSAGSYSVGSDPQRAVVADLNGDGKLDLVVVNPLSNNLSVLLGNGNGTFQTAVNYATGNLPDEVIAADLNGDGSLDLAAVNENDNTVAVFLGNGDGTFQAPSAIGTGLLPQALAAADFNGDGRMDLVVANRNGNTISVLLQVSSVTLSSSSLTFGNQAVNATSAPQTVTVTNTGSANLSISPVTIGGPNASDFAKSADTCSDGSVTTSSTCTVSVTFTPSAAGTRNASLIFTDNSNGVAGSTQTVNLSGTGTSGGTPIASLSPTTLAFQHNLNLSCPPKPITIQNTGTVPLLIQSITTTGTFSQTNTCENSLAPESTCEIDVSFTAEAPVNTYSGTLTITDNATGSPQVVPLSGQVFPPCLMKSDAPIQQLLRSTPSTTFNIVDTQPSCHTATVTMACSNNAPATCVFNPPAMAPGGSTVLTVQNLKALTADNFNFTATGTDITNTTSLNLSLLLSDFSFTPAATSATVTAGQTASYAMTLTPVNGLSGAIQLACQGAPTGSTCTVSPSTVTLAQNVPVQVTVSVTTGSRSMGAPRGDAPLQGPGASLRLWLELASLLVLLGILIGAALGTRRARAQQPNLARQRLSGLVLAALALLLMVWVACGSGGGSISNMTSNSVGTPAGTYALTVTGTFNTSGGQTTTLSRTQTLSLQVK